MNFTVLSQRLEPSPGFDGPYPGIQPWMKKGITDFILGSLTAGGYMRDVAAIVEKRLQVFEEFRHEAEPGNGDALAAVRRALEDEAYCWDLIDFALHEAHSWGAHDHAKGLTRFFVRVGSVWAVEPTPDQRGFMLVLREGVDTSAVRAVVRSHSEDVADLLDHARAEIYGRKQDAKSAYQHVTEALELAMTPVVCPNDERPSLGKMLGALLDKPSKWAYRLEWTQTDGPGKKEITQADALVPLIRSVQRTQARHGGQEPVSLTEAEDAYIVAVSACALFLNGSVSLRGGE